MIKAKKIEIRQKKNEIEGIKEKIENVKNIIGISKSFTKNSPDILKGQGKSSFFTQSWKSQVCAQDP